MVLKGLNIDGVIKVDNARVYGLDESIIASGYPMQVNTEDMENVDLTEKDYKRIKHLGNAVPGSGHDCFLKGIIVQFDLQVPEYIWRQLDRYHFIDYISSQSKMHRILKIDIDKACNKYVHKDTINNLKNIISLYNSLDDMDKRLEAKYGQILNEDIESSIKIELRDGECVSPNKKELFNMIIANTPSGLMLTARMTTNYLQLKSIINQRSNHKMQEWRYLCDWFKTLPMFEELVCRSRC